MHPPIARLIPALSLLFPALIALTSPAGLSAQTPVDFADAQSRITEEKGSAATGSQWTLAGGQTPSLEWGVETSAAEEFDFARLTIPVEAVAQPGSAIVLTGDLALAPDHFLNVELVTEAGTVLYTAIKNPASGESEYRLPVDKFSAADGAEFSLPATLVALRIMVSGDQSPQPGSSRVVIKSLALE